MGFKWDSSKEKYVALVIVPVVFFLSSFIPLLYGWQAWVLPVQLETYNVTSLNELSFKDGIATFISSLCIFLVTIMTVFAGPLVTYKTWGVQLAVFAGIFLSSIGICLTAVGISATKGWLLWVGFGVLNGLGFGLLVSVMNIFTIQWFREIGRPGLGAGYVGFISGLWPAIFAYATPALIDWVGVPGSLYTLCILMVCLSGPTIIFLHKPLDNWVSFPSSKSQDQDSEEEEGFLESTKGSAIAKEEKETSSKEVIPLSEMLKTKQYLQLVFGFFLFLYPGFGAKLVMTPLLVSYFDSSVSTQSLVSFLFFVFYALTRLIVGQVADKIPLQRLFLLFGVLQFIGVTGLGCVVFFQLDVVVFIVMELFLAIAFAGTKVLLSLSSLQVFGAQNFSKIFGCVLQGYGTAGAIGPITMWAAVSQKSKYYNDQGQPLPTGDGQPWLLAIALWFWLASGMTPVATFLLYRGVSSPMPYA